MPDNDKRLYMGRFYLLLLLFWLAGEAVVASGYSIAASKCSVWDRLESPISTSDDVEVPSVVSETGVVDSLTWSVYPSWAL